MKYSVVLMIIFFIISCQKKEDKKEICPTKNKKFEMYEMSEMALLMEQMYAYNLGLKEKIIKGENLGEFPVFFNKIHNSKFTTPSDNDDFFKEKAKEFVLTQQQIYLNTKDTKQKFNASVDACIACHEGKCGGPIPRIKKLYID